MENQNSTVHPTHQELGTIDPSVRTTISVFGLGYVGIVSSACLAKAGHRVIGVDTNLDKVNLLNEGYSPIVEKGLSELIGEGISNHQFMATRDIDFAIKNTKVSFVCVGTPSASDGSLDLTFLKQVSADIGRCLKAKSTTHTIVFRSTMEPGTTERILTPIIEEASGKKVNSDFFVCFHPEFLREGTALDDFFSPPKTVIGSSSKTASEIVAKIYSDLFKDDIIHSSLEVAEMVKYVDNTWHAVKVSFANEIGRICQACNTDGHTVMDIFCQDKKLNLSPYYLKPGFAFGGSCLPKDVRGINKLAKNSNVQTPLLNSIINSNETQISHAVEMVKKIGNKNVAILGLTFKQGTDDLRETPTIPMISELLDLGFTVKVFDENIKSKKPLLHYLQHAECASMAVKDFCNNFEKYQSMSLGEVLKNAETIVVTHDTEIFTQIASQRTDKQTVVDLVRLYANQNGLIGIQEVGMNDFLQKPALASELERTLCKHIPNTSDQGIKHILLAEDNIPMSTVLQFKLSSLGYRVDTVCNGQDAVYMARTKPYDAILMDLHMPVLDGFEATRQIRQLDDGSANVPIIALSGNITPEISNTYYGLCW